MSLRLSVVNFWLRWTEKPYLARMTSFPEARKRFRRLADRMFRRPAATRFQVDRLSFGGRDVPVLWVSHEAASRRSVLLYLHGGAYVMGSPDTHAGLVACLAGNAGIRGVLPDYRLAPEHPFPAALEDALTCFQALLAAGYSPDRIAVGGDSAGGGLALALLHQINAMGLPQPASSVLFSPWTDLTLSGGSLVSNARRDSVLPAGRMPELVARYLGDASPNDPRASPLFGDFTGCGPVLIQASRSEILRDDTLRMGRVLQAAGCDVQIQTWRNTPHVWQLFQGRLPEADMALAQAGSFLARHIGGLPGETMARSRGAS